MSTRTRSTFYAVAYSMSTNCETNYWKASFFWGKRSQPKCPTMSNALLRSGSKYFILTLIIEVQPSTEPPLTQASSGKRFALEKALLMSLHLANSWSETVHQRSRLNVAAEKNTCTDTHTCKERLRIPGSNSRQPKIECIHKLGLQM